VKRHIPEIPDVVEAAESYRNMSTPGFGRSLEGIKELIAGVELVEPGLVWTPQWRPENPEDVPEHPERSMVLAGVGRKPPPRN
jgi:hypothetical protein